MLYQFFWPLYAQLGVPYPRVSFCGFIILGGLIGAAGYWLIHNYHKHMKASSLLPAFGALANDHPRMAFILSVGFCSFLSGCAWAGLGNDYNAKNSKQVVATSNELPKVTVMPEQNPPIPSSSAQNTPPFQITPPPNETLFFPSPVSPTRTIGDNSVVMGNVPGNVGNGSVVIGATDDRGNTIIDTPMTVGAGAHGSPGSITIGAGASTGPTSSGSQSPAIVNLTVSGPGAVGVNYGNMTTNKIANATFNITYNGPNTSTPSITLDGKWLEKNSVQPNGQYLTRGLITINSPYVVGTLDVEVTGETIKGFIVTPVGRAGSMGEMGSAGKTYFRKIYSASGQYVFMIFSSSPEEFQIHFHLEN